MEQESNEQEPNEATEIVGGKVETVEVSKHPEASIPETDLSLADIERRRSHPLRWALIILAVLCAIIAPYWFGRSLAQPQHLQIARMRAVETGRHEFFAGRQRLGRLAEDFFSLIHRLDGRFFVPRLHHDEEIGILGAFKQRDQQA